MNLMTHIQSPYKNFVIKWIVTLARWLNKASKFLRLKNISKYRCKVVPINLITFS